MGGETGEVKGQSYKCEILTPSAEGMGKKTIKRPKFTSQTENNKNPLLWARTEEWLERKFCNNC